MKEIALARKDFEELDRAAVEEFHVSIDFLMENAGRAVANEVEEVLKKSFNPQGVVLILCGSGNNGGDGMCCALHLKRMNFNVKVAILKEPSALKDAALRQYEKINSEKISHILLPDFKELMKEIEQSTIIVDAMLGTGFKGAVKEPMNSVIEAVNASEKYVIAVDIPSGMDADTGKPAGNCIQAANTVTFAALKKGFSHPQAKEWTGKITVADIGFPKTLLHSFGLLL